MKRYMYGTIHDVFDLNDSRVFAQFDWLSFRGPEAMGEIGVWQHRCSSVWEGEGGF